MLGTFRRRQQHTGRCRTKCQSQRGGGSLSVAERLVNWDRHKQRACHTPNTHMFSSWGDPSCSVLCVAYFLASCAIAPTRGQSCNVFPWSSRGRGAFLERLPRAEWDDPFETTFWSLGNLRLPALHGVVPRGYISWTTKYQNESVLLSRV